MATATPDDERAAASIYTSLSSYVITASLGVIAAQAALATFVLDKRDHLLWFYIWMVWGLDRERCEHRPLGGRGIVHIASDGFDGEWTLKPKGGDLFNYQAIFCLLGMALLLGSLFSGTPKVESSPVTQEILNNSKIRCRNCSSRLILCRPKSQRPQKKKSTPPASPPRRHPTPSRKCIDDVARPGKTRRQTRL